MKKLFIVIMFLSVNAAFAQGGTFGPLTWNIHNNILTISGEGAMPNYEEPGHMPWRQYQFRDVIIETGVTSISDYAFWSHRYLLSVTLSNTVKSIGKFAFYMCPHLYSITLGEGLTSIGEMAFYRCSLLLSITLPNSVTSIGEGAFRDCFDLRGSIVIPDGVTRIEVGTFSGCENLWSVTIGNGVESIGVAAFSGCRSLTSITFGEKVSSIESYAFAACLSLSEISLPYSITSIGSDAFRGCSRLDEIVLPYGITSIEESTFSHCYGLRSVEIPNNVSKIDNNAFSSCYTLSSFTFPKSITTLGREIFTFCNNLTSITNLNPNPIEIEYYVFEEDLYRNCTLIVPTNAVAAYQEAEVWKEFNIVGGGWLVSSISNHIEQGYTKGDSLYQHNETATVTAFARANYKFVNWTLNGEIVSTENPYSFTVTEDTEWVANFVPNIGIEEATTLPDIRVYPNPTTGKLTIEFTSGQADEWTSGQVNEIEIYDIQGRRMEIPHCVRNDVIPSVVQRNEESRTINISHLPAGIYFVKIATTAGEVVKKVVKE